jgi:23S rRNA (pseudouridine1915-N3)-methyltransferase
MRVTLAAVGRARDEPEAALFQRYWERAAALGPKLGFGSFSTAFIELSRKPTVAERIREEADRLERCLPRAAHVMVLDSRGQSLTSDAFAGQLARCRDTGIADIAFVIGGPDGLLPEFRDSAKARIAFGLQTWPHLLVRTLLAEQIFRALSILAGHPYHRA